MDNELEDLPDFLTRAWLFDLAEARRSENLIYRTDWTVSSLTERYLKSRLASYSSSRDDHGDGGARAVPPLTTISIGKIHEILATSDNRESDIRTISRNLPATVLCQILRDERTPYPVLRAFLRERTPAAHSGYQNVCLASLQDIDEAVLVNEKYIRSRSAEDNMDHKYLVTLEELVKLLETVNKDYGDIVSFRRTNPPLGGLELLDRRRPCNLEILSHSAAFAATFERITNGILTGLDWTNVFVAGGIVLSTLMHTDPSKDDDKTIKDGDIDLYLYGLDADQANKKVEEIYDIWLANLPATNKQRLVVKNARTINFLADYPNRRIQIILKLLPSPTQILLNFDLDACAVGFDGKQVLMLPRCARAIETGYSVFTMDLIWGHYLGDRRATRETRVFKYADRGFGLRILPSYARSLEDETPFFKLANSQQMEIDFLDDSWAGSSSEPVSRPLSLTIPRKTFGSQESYRRPEGSEPGLKTLKRVAYLGQDFTTRYCFGDSPLRKVTEIAGKSRASSDSRSRTTQDLPLQNNDGETGKEEFQVGGNSTEVPSISLTNLDMRRGRRNVPDGFGGLGQFELFMRHCKAWELDADGQVTLNRALLNSTLYFEVGAYDEPFTYVWNESFNTDAFAYRMIHEDDRLFGLLKNALSRRLSIPNARSGYRDYLTRRIRRQVHGPDLRTVMEKQITLPMVIPHDVEELILNSLPQTHSDLPAHFTSSPILIPVHRPPPAGHAPLFLPSIHDQATEDGNLRYWVISNHNMWACQHRVVDEVFEILNSFFHLFSFGVNLSRQYTCATPEALWHLASDFRRRAILPEVPAARNKRTHKSGLLLREAMLFRAWVFAEPCRLTATAFIRHENDQVTFPYCDEEDFIYPVPEELFWKGVEEGTHEGDGVPLWRDIDEEVGSNDY